MGKGHIRTRVTAARIIVENAWKGLISSTAGHRAMSQILHLAPLMAADSHSNLVAFRRRRYTFSNLRFIGNAELFENSTRFSTYSCQLCMTRSPASLWAGRVIVYQLTADIIKAMNIYKRAQIVSFDLPQCYPGFGIFLLL